MPADRLDQRAISVSQCLADRKQSARDGRVADSENFRFVLALLARFGVRWTPDRSWLRARIAVALVDATLRKAFTRDVRDVFRPAPEGDRSDRLAPILLMNASGSRAAARDPGKLSPVL